LPLLGARKQSGVLTTPMKKNKQKPAYGGFLSEKGGEWGGGGGGRRDHRSGNRQVKNDGADQPKRY